MKPGIIWGNRAAFLIIALIPFIYIKPFFIHFRAFLTGSILLGGIVSNQWHLVVICILAYGFFIIPLTYRKRAKWVDYGLVGAFFISLFVEMFGIPLTILFAHKFFLPVKTFLPSNVVSFHFLGVYLGLTHAMAYGMALMIIGVVLIMVGWKSLYTQVRLPGFAQNGIYRFSRHPQYVGFLLLVTGWFFGWPTILTVVFAPILIYKYISAARAEERDMLEAHGDAYKQYIQSTPFLI